jgi:hypothetical protein
MNKWTCPEYCLFTPVAERIPNSDLRVKLENQFRKQSQLVPLVPLSMDEAIDGSIIHWLPSQIEDIMYLEMCESEIQDPKESPGAKTSRYYIEAAKYAGRISAGSFDGKNAKFKPLFKLHYKDFTPRLNAELRLLLKDSPSTLMRVVQNAVFRIFRARHKLIFFDYIQSEGLNWRFVGE